MTSQEDVAWQLEPVLGCYSSHVDKAYVLSEHLDSHDLNLSNLDAFL